jgi:hypothetical protein
MTQIDGRAVLTRVARWVDARHDELISEWADWIRQRPAADLEGSAELR